LIRADVLRDHSENKEQLNEVPEDDRCRGADAAKI